MIKLNFDVVDGWFEAGKDSERGPMRFALFNRKVLFPLDHLASEVKRETGEECTVEVLQKKAAEGWFPLLSMPGVPDELGASQYVSTRRSVPSA